jgi:transposase
MYNQAMPKQIDYTLTKEELDQVQAAMKSKQVKVARRASVVHSLHLGYSAPEVAEVHQISIATVYNHYHRFKTNGAKGLSNQAIVGRPPKADEAYRKRLVEVIETAPLELGLGFSIWTLASLQAYMLRETGIKLSQNRLSEVLQAAGYVYRRPKKDLGHKQDPELREQVQAAIDAAKKTPAKTLSNYSLWMKVGSV